MNSIEQPASTADILNSVVSDINSERLEDLSNKLDEFHPSEVANLLESLPPVKRKILWGIIPGEQEGEVLTHMRDEARAAIIEEMKQDQLLAAAGNMNASKLANVLGELPNDISDNIFQALEDDHRKRLETVLSYDEKTAGRIMNTDVISVRQNVTLAVVLRWLRRHLMLPVHTDALMVIDEENRYLGKLHLSNVVIGAPDELVQNVMRSDANSIKASCSITEVAALFERRDLISVAVLDENDHLLGRITIDDVVDIIREQADATLLKSAGLNEEQDLFSPILPSAKQRGLWLGLNLITVFFAAWVIGQFQEVLDEIVALAVLMPIVASMGGIAGSQTLTLTIRGLALDQIAKSNIKWLTMKEIAVGGLNGLVWAVTVAIASFIWFDNKGIAIILAVAMLLNLLAASLSGVIIPLILNRMGIDPALSGAVILTTITDVIGFLSFLGLASLYLL
ncbi:MAG: magnesium transporter [Gammaproteobacteria bacterium]|nr:magnesium transporter [Gammaproteobacteria bacterium]